MKIKLMGLWVIYYKLLCSSFIFKGVFFPLHNTPCIVEELCECGFRTTFQENNEDKISQQCPLLFDPFSEALLGDGGFICFEFWRNALQ